MNKMLIATTALVGAFMVAGCASSGLSDEEMAKVGPWYDMAVVLKDASDPELNEPINTQIAAVDVVANTVSPIATKVSGMTAEYIRRVYADTAWDTYTAWYNGPVASQLTGDALTGAAQIQSKMACFEQGLALNSADPLADARRVLTFREVDRADDAAVKQFFADNGSETLTVWGDALIAAQGKTREDFYAAVKVAPADKDNAGTIAYLEKVITDMTTASTQLTAALSDADLAKKMAAASFGAEIVAGVSGKETLAEIDRLKDQIAVVGRLAPWLLDAVRNDK